MKIKITFLNLTFALLVIGCTDSNLTKTLNVDKYWKFKLGDSAQWGRPDYLDYHWDSIIIGTNLASKPFDNYNGYAWYRTKVFIPSSIKDEAFLKDSVKFFLGTIDDCDQVYLNGNLIGENTKVMPDHAIPTNSFTGIPGFWDKERKYVLPVSDKRILWDKENVIAIRIFDQYGGGGIYSKRPALGMLGMEDYITIDQSKFYKVVDNRYVDKMIIIKNTSLTIPIDGVLLLTAKNKALETTVYEERFVIKVSPQRSIELTADLPISTDPLLLTFEIKDDYSKTSTTFQDSIPYNLSK